MALVTTKEMLKRAHEGHYAVGAFNVDSAEIFQGVLDGAERANSPVIIAVTGRMFGDLPYLKAVVADAAEKSPVPVALHLDHGKSVELCKKCVDMGFTSVMIDASMFDFATNIRLTREVVEYAHARGIPVESELGALTGVEDDVNVDDKYGCFTHPNDVLEFVSQTGIDSLAIAIGTSHGVYKFKPDQRPQLRFDILDEVRALLPDFPLVLHGASSVPADRLEIFNAHGGRLPQAKGIPEEMLIRAIQKGVCKINVCNDIRITYFGELRRQFALKPDKADAHEFFAPARQAVSDLVFDKIVNVLGSKNKIGY